MAAKRCASLQTHRDEMHRRSIFEESGISCSRENRPSSSGCIFHALLMLGLPILTRLRFFGRLLIGLGIYRFYSMKRSEFGKVSWL